MLSKKINKKGQVGDTVTWVVATIIIIVLLMFFIFGTSLLSGTKKVTGARESLTSKITLEKNDLFLEKSLFTYFKIGDKSEKIKFYKKLVKMDEGEIFSVSLNDTRDELGGVIGK